MLKLVEFARLNHIYQYCGVAFDHKCVLPYKHRTILGMLLKLVGFFGSHADVESYCPECAPCGRHSGSNCDDGLYYSTLGLIETVPKLYSKEEPGAVASAL